MNRVNSNYSGRRRRNGHVPVIVIIFPLIFVIVGIIVLCSTISSKMENDSFLQRAEPVYGTCTRVWSQRSGSRKHKTTHYYAYARYDYHGLNYQSQRLTVNSTTHQGDIIQLYVDPLHPADARQEMSTSNFAGGVVFGIVFILMGSFVSWSMIHSIRQSAQRTDRELSAYDNYRQSNWNPNNPYTSPAYGEDSRETNQFYSGNIFDDR